MDRDTALSLLREQVLGIVIATAFVATGLVAWAVAVVRRRSGARVFAWLGAWSAVYGLQEFVRTTSAVAALPRGAQAAVPLASVALSYLVLVVAVLAWVELTRGPLRGILRAITAAALLVAAAGIGTFLLTGEADAFRLPNTVLAVLALLVLLAFVALPPRLASRYIALPRKGVLLAGTLVFATQALYANVARSLGYSSPPLMDRLGFAALLFSFGYAALEAVLASERRLQSIESELAVARRLQLSILPAAVPRLEGARVAAAYEPMTAVAGDVYEFLPVDSHRAGFLVADVSGHGVPAALIASMIKVAVESVAAWADDPAELLRRLGAALHGHLRGQYVTAAYLWLDTAAHTARYAAAGHPPLLLWRAATATATSVESNGLLFGVVPESDYASCEVPFERGDRFLLYTDGLTETENAAGEPFGESRLQQVLGECRSETAEEVSRRLRTAVAAWRPASVPQQDDITFVLIETLSLA